MRVKKSTVVRLTREALVQHLGSLLEAPHLGDAEEDNEKKEKDKVDPKVSDTPKTGNMKEPRGKREPKELPAVEDPADADLEAEPDLSDEKPQDPKVSSDEVEDADEVTGGGIAAELEGKKIQTITMSPKSKILPGSQEIEIQFADSPDPLKILISKSGDVKFFYDGGVHNEL